MPHIPLYLLWLAAVIGFVIIEAVTLGLACIWFALGALAALILSLIGISLPLQIAAFVVVSAASLILLKPFAAKHLYTNRTATNADRVLEAKGIVTEEIDNERSCGQVKVNGQIWTARAANADQKIAIGSHVIIKEISGVKLLVETIEETKECTL